MRDWYASLICDGGDEGGVLLAAYIAKSNISMQGVSFFDSILVSCDDCRGVDENLCTSFG